ncbi:hypothetical protein [Microbacterium sp. CGR1]|uniref:hypothetical protein n=1 Tax=Microbacterium sp. CGR1 TaxID=1696072 RepID=UPI003DA6C344
MPAIPTLPGSEAASTDSGANRTRSAILIVGMPGAGGVAAVGDAGWFERRAQRVVPESFMQAARSIASSLGPDGPR